MVWATPATAQCPPAQWDRPYSGNLTVTRTDLLTVQRRCAGASRPLLSFILACAWVRDGNCEVVLWDLAPDCTRRHEIAHCNGWKHEPR